MKFQTIASIAESRPIEPVFAFRPAALNRAVDYFCTKFSGQVLYPVKTNPEKHIIQAVHTQGVTAFDVASYEEIRVIKKYASSAELYFMHPVKSPRVIREAYFKYGVRHFSLDCVDELDKIIRSTENAKDLCLYLRLAIPNAFAEFNLTEKFGIDLHEAPALLKQVRKVSYKLGVTFHVGSQCMHPDAYRIAIRMANKVINEAQVDIEFFNVGGGFPSIYPGMIPPMLAVYFDAIHAELAKVVQKRPHIQLLCEPGRSLVAESTSVIVNVELRKDNMLYINDGTYGSLFDAGIPHFIFPVHLVRVNNPTTTVDLLPFSFYGPTCDSLDYMKGPFYLPNDVEAGDYIEIGQIGAYGRTLSTKFNGFKQKEGVIMVADEPLMTMYSDDYITHEPLEVIAA
ncbi:type III PLP-dependent enzyme [Coxiella endosymbiont of Amblyomma nuttalli]|uniref:type III PLP-dependent enzyme n=1 Tax=Coxiella endosymbiont of Amblyomma nuttalli TaxID=2749996 RepID=UPI001BAB4260|nr:type III PLP-dependent enzyme [Coxiella endosymbiont of Amblyomma nuttalli]QTS84140.1 Lysine/ornithine decarboxylase [Coxiella endosymbiont of Amblyomma nuttalli]